MDKKTTRAEDKRIEELETENEGFMKTITGLGSFLRRMRMGLLKKSL